MFCIFAHLLGNAVCAENDSSPIRYFVELLDEDCAFLCKIIDHETVVHHFMAHIDRGAENLQCTFDNIDGAIDAGTEATWIGKVDIDRHWSLIFAWALLISSISTVNTSG